MTRRDELAATILQGMIMGRYFVYSVPKDQIAEKADEWVDIAYMLADACIKRAEKN